MTRPLTEIEPLDPAGHLRVVVETPAGSRLKLKYDPDLGTFVWSRKLAAGVTFPFDYGFVPQTLSGDGDALDAMVYSDTPSQSGVVVPSRIIGALMIEQQRDGQAVKRNDRLIVVPIHDHHLAHLADVHDLAERARDELVEFFRASLVLTGKRVRFRGWAGARDAREILDRAIESAASAVARPAG